LKIQEKYLENLSSIVLSSLSTEKNDEINYNVSMNYWHAHSEYLTVNYAVSVEYWPQLIRYRNLLNLYDIQAIGDIKSNTVILGAEWGVTKIIYR